jgi:hypothetical protein
MNNMSADEIDALAEIQKEILKWSIEDDGTVYTASDLLDCWQQELASVPLHDLNREINNLGVIIRETMQKLNPQMSEAKQYSYAFAAIELLRNRMKAN